MIRTVMYLPLLFLLVYLYNVFIHNHQHISIPMQFCWIHYNYVNCISLGNRCRHSLICMVFTSYNVIIINDIYYIIY